MGENRGLFPPKRGGRMPKQAEGREILWITPQQKFGGEQCRPRFLLQLRVGVQKQWRRRHCRHEVGNSVAPGGEKFQPGRPLQPTHGQTSGLGVQHSHAKFEGQLGPAAIERSPCTLHLLLQARLKGGDGYF